MELPHPYQKRQGGSRLMLWDEARLPPQLRQGSRQVGWVDTPAQEVRASGVGAYPNLGAVVESDSPISTITPYLPYIAIAGVLWWYWDDIKDELGL